MPLKKTGRNALKFIPQYDTDFKIPSSLGFQV